jgi:hypothetical protein
MIFNGVNQRQAAFAMLATEHFTAADPYHWILLHKLWFSFGQ